MQVLIGCWLFCQPLTSWNMVTLNRRRFWTHIYDFYLFQSTDIGNTTNNGISASALEIVLFAAQGREKPLYEMVTINIAGTSIYSPMKLCEMLQSDKNRNLWIEPSLWAVHNDNAKWIEYHGPANMKTDLLYQPYTKVAVKFWLVLIHWSRNNADAVSQTIFSNALFVIWHSLLYHPFTNS